MKKRLLSLISALLVLAMTPAIALASQETVFETKENVSLEKQTRGTTSWSVYGNYGVPALGANLLISTTSRGFDLTRPYSFLPVWLNGYTGSYQFETVSTSLITVRVSFYNSSNGDSGSHLVRFTP